MLQWCTVYYGEGLQIPYHRGFFLISSHNISVFRTEYSLWLICRGWLTVYWYPVISLVEWDHVWCTNLNPSGKWMFVRPRDAILSFCFSSFQFVSFIFWVLYAVDRELIFPASLDEWFPSWLNHIMHTLPAVGAFVELYSVHHTYQKGWKLFTPILCAYALYLSWYVCIITYGYNIKYLQCVKYMSNLITFYILYRGSRLTRRKGVKKTTCGYRKHANQIMEPFYLIYDASLH